MRGVTNRRGQAMVELAMGMVLIVLTVSLVCWAMELITDTNRELNTSRLKHSKMFKLDL